MARLSLFYFISMSDYLEVLNIVVIGLVGLIITFYYQYHNSKLAHDKMNKELFTEFNKRYDALNDFLLEIEATCKTLEDVSAKPELKYKLNDFFNLCAEEYYWKQKGRIDKSIWEGWCAGMNSWYNRVDIIQEAWDVEIEKYGCKAYYIKRKDDFFKKAS